jgi:hypothetical protein
VSLVLTSAPHITSVLLKGLNNLVLPFTSHVLDPGLHGAADDALSSSTRAQNNDKYFVKSISGLEAPDRNVAIAAGPSGGKFQGVTVEDREVVVLIGLNPDWNAGETPKLLRDNLYIMLYTGYNPRVDIQLMSGTTPKYHEYGYVEKFEASIFDANPMVQITFKCLNPTFRAFDVTQFNAGSLSETHPNIYNHGTAETGFKFGVKFTADKDNWSIKQAENRNIGMSFEHSFHDGDLLTVNTIPGERYVHLQPHRKKVKNMLGILTADSEWIQLHPGHNHFVVPKKTGKWDWKGKLSFTAHSAGL